MMKITSRFCFFFFLIFASTLIFAGNGTCSEILTPTDSCRNFADTNEANCEQYYQTSLGVNYYCKTAQNSTNCIKWGGTWEEEGPDYECRCPPVDNVSCKWNNDYGNRNCDGYQYDETGC
tara:strand:+ start:203 stop:562 length:360 start_codon:yes stop_codon:yes gene_type:complete